MKSTKYEAAYGHGSRSAIIANVTEEGEIYIRIMNRYANYENDPNRVWESAVITIPKEEFVRMLSEIGVLKK